MSKRPAPSERELFSLIVEMSRSAKGLQQLNLFSNEVNLEGDEPYCCGISLTQFYVLSLVEKSGSLKMSQIVENLWVDKSTASRIVNPLVEKKLIKKSPSPDDARALNLSLTEEGHEMLAGGWGDMTRIMVRIEKSIPENEREQVYNSVIKFIKAIRQVCNEFCC